MSSSLITSTIIRKLDFSNILKSIMEHHSLQIAQLAYGFLAPVGISSFNYEFEMSSKSGFYNLSKG